MYYLGGACRAFWSCWWRRGAGSSGRSHWTDNGWRRRAGSSGRGCCGRPGPPASPDLSPAAKISTPPYRSIPFAIAVPNSRGELGDCWTPADTVRWNIADCQIWGRSISLAIGDNIPFYPKISSNNITHLYCRNGWKKRREFHNIVQKVSEQRDLLSK